MTTTLHAFKALGLSDTTLKSLQKKGFEEPTHIQAKAIPILMDTMDDLVGQAQTGTGKTAAFGLPLVEKFSHTPHVQALILTPTRELAIQVSEEIYSLKGDKRLEIAPIYGGQSIEQQLRRLSKGVDIVVGTPGRILDHLERRSLDLSHISYFVLDEADEMLKMGFIDDVEAILRTTNKEKRMLLFSATMPPQILKLAQRYMRKYQFIAVQKEQLTTSLTDQIYFEVMERDKFEALCRIIDMEKDFYGLIFCRTKMDVDDSAAMLLERGYDAAALHGDMSQHQREKILNKFKRKKITILVATDVAARGIDIDSLTHVINYSLPQDPESYVHRIGRTGRSGKEGTAITFVTPDEYRKLVFIKRYANTDIRKEKIPHIKDVIEAKRTRIVDELRAVIDAGIDAAYTDMVHDLLEKYDAEQVVSGVLKYAFQDMLDESHYNEIRTVSVNRTGTTRLFVARGKNDGMTPRSLIDFIRHETNVGERNIYDVKIFEMFSFITVSFEDAEIILDIFKRKHPGKRPLVDRAKEEHTSHGSGGDRRPPYRSSGHGPRKYR